MAILRSPRREGRSAELRRTRETPGVRKWALHFLASPVGSRCSPEGRAGERQGFYIQLMLYGEMAEAQGQTSFKSVMTRAAYKRKEKEQRKKEPKDNSSGNASPPVGGARPKSYATHAALSELDGVFSRLRAKGDGKVFDLEC